MATRIMRGLVLGGTLALLATACGTTDGGGGTTPTKKDTGAADVADAGDPAETVSTDSGADDVPFEDVAVEDVGVAKDVNAVVDTGKPSDGDPDGAVAGETSGTPDTADLPDVPPDVPQAKCCPIAPAPSCDCTKLGGSPLENGNCPSVCDAAPVGWKKTTDEHGCPMWIPGSQSCMAVDAGSSDAGAPDAGAADSGPVDAGPIDSGPADTGAGTADTATADILGGVSCGAGKVLFPKFDKSCKVADDCAVVEHQVNCCGTKAAWGITKTELAGFTSAEALCQKQYPKCKCATMPTKADDGNTTLGGGSFAVDCVKGQCWTFVTKP